MGDQHEGGEAARDPRVGRVLGGVYELVGRLGEGGMGVVYEARHATLGRTFAVKVLSGDRAPGSDALERFRQEAVQASRIEHDHIVDVVHFDTGDGGDGEPYLVMERLRGESLAARLARGGPLPREEALTLARQVGDALAAAHARGIVHRDLKPENVFLVDKGGRPFAKVLDFGISKMRGEGDEGVRLTATGHLVGTPLYISPELARGETDRVDARADVYALGCLLYEMLTGSPPFDGANAYQLLWKHGQEAPEPPSSRAPEAGVDEAVERAVLRALEKDPDRRFPSMRAFLDALPGPEPTASDAGPAPYGPRRFLVELAAIVALGVALVGAALVVRAVRGPTEAPAPSATRGGEPGVPAPEQAAAGGGGDPGRVATDGAGAGAATPGGATAPGAEGAPPVAVRFVSQPPGARVWAGDRLLGQAPLEVPLPADGAAHEVRFALDGFAPRRVTVVPGRDRVVEVALRRLRSPSEPPPSNLPPIKRTL